MRTASPRAAVSCQCAAAALLERRLEKQTVPHHMTSVGGSIYQFPIWCGVASDTLIGLYNADIFASSKAEAELRATPPSQI